MRKEPLFIRFVNGVDDVGSIIDSVYNSSNDEKTKEIAGRKKQDIPNLDVFKRDFKKAIEDLIDSGINQHFINYVNSYMKPSLIEEVEDSSVHRTGERRTVRIKEEETPWIEAIVCYNLCIYIRTFGIKEIKLCPVCHKFFSNKGKYAKYCSEGCKMQGKSK